MAVSRSHALWEEVAEKAAERIDSIDFHNLDRRQVLEQIVQLVRDRQQDVAQNRWKITKSNGQTVYAGDIYERIATCVQKFQAVGDIACQADAGHASLPWAAVRLVLQATVNLQEKDRAVFEGLDLTSDLITQSAIVEKLYLAYDLAYTAPAGQLREALARLYTHILRFLSDAFRYCSKSGIARFGTSLIHPAEATLQLRIADIVRENAVVHRLCDHVQGQWSINFREQVSKEHAALQDLLASMQSPVNDILNGVNRLLQREGSLENTTYLDWLSPIPYAQHHADVASDRLQKTGGWLIDTDVFGAWNKSLASSLFWLQGLPGCGKTRLVSAIIDHTKSQEQAPDDQLSLAFVYFARDTAEKQRGDPVEAIRSIARQLCVSRGRIQLLKDLYAIKQHLNTPSDVPPRLSLAEALEFVYLVTEDATAYIVLDAMDECDGSRRNDLIRGLATLLVAQRNTFRIFVSSRDQVHQLFKTQRHLEITPEDNFQDIERFIDTKVSEYVAEGRLLQGHVSNALEHQIAENLKQKAQGMFLWVSLQHGALSNSERMIMEADVVNELANLPETLNDLYVSAFDQVTRAGYTSLHIAVTTLQWLLCAQRPLDSKEIIGAVTVDHEENVISVTLEQIVASCRNLVLHDKKLDVLRFAHLSVRDFLEKQSEFKVSENESVVAERCLDVVSATYSGVFVKGQHLQQNIDLQRYAKIYWMSHSQNLQLIKVPNRIEKKLFRFFFRGEHAVNSFQRWASTVLNDTSLELTHRPTRTILDNLQQVAEQPATPLFAACMLGLTQVLAHIKQQSPNGLFRTTKSGKSLMELATETGQFGVVELLLGPANHVAGQGPLPLTKVMANADHDPSVLYYIAAIQAAVSSERKDVIDMLAVRGNRSYGSVRLLDYALESAAWIGDSRMVSVLLTKGAEARTPRPGYQYDLLAKAVQCGMRDLVEHLLDNGADIHAVSRDGRGLSAIEYAAVNGHAEIIQLLMKRGASVMTKEMDMKWTAFHDAASYDDVQCLDALWQGMVRYGRRDALTTLNMQTRDDWENALHTAVRHGAVKSTTWLLDHGIDVPPDKEGFTPFHRASVDNNADLVHKNAELVRLILSAGHVAKEQLIQRRISGNLTALHCAAFHGSTEICTEIMRWCPDSTLNTDGDEYTPLHLAAMWGHRKTVECLLSIGDHRCVDMQNKWQLTALMEAVANGYPDTVAELLKQGADPSISITGVAMGTEFDSYNPFLGADFTAIHTAVAWQQPTSLKLLLDHGMKCMTREHFATWVKKKDWWGRTALEIAMDLEDEDLYTMLGVLSLPSKNNIVNYDIPLPEMDSLSLIRQKDAEGRPGLVWSRRDLPAAARPSIPVEESWEYQEERLGQRRPTAFGSSSGEEENSDNREDLNGRWGHLPPGHKSYGERIRHREDLTATSSSAMRVQSPWMITSNVSAVRKRYKPGKKKPLSRPELQIEEPQTL